MGARGEEGFTLVEMLIALIIMIAMTTLLYRGFSGGLSAADKASGAEAALLVAQARLAAVGTETPLEAGEQEGSEGGVTWRTSLRPYQQEDNGGAPVVGGFSGATAAAPPKAFWASVTVIWREKRGGGRRSLHLTTLKLEAPK